VCVLTWDYSPFMLIGFWATKTPRLEDIKNKYFSARRASRLKHNDYGRNISIIMLN